MSGFGWLVAVSAIPAAWLLHWAGGFPLVVGVTVAVIAAALAWAAPRDLLARLGGQLLALWALSGGLWFAGVAAHIFPYPGWIGGFLLCQGLRFAFVGRMPRVWDELAAGSAAALITLAGAAISHGWLA